MAVIRELLLRRVALRSVLETHFALGLVLGALAGALVGAGDAAVEAVRPLPPATLKEARRSPPFAAHLAGDAPARLRRIVLRV